MRIDSSQIAATLRRAEPKPDVGTPMAGECSDLAFPGRAPVFGRRADFHRNCVVMKRAALLNMKAIFFAVLLAFVVLSKAFAADVLQAFPPAEAGMVRHVISLPKQDDESILKIELIIGKTVIIDETNHYFFGGALETESISGWGFERYILHKLGPLAGTLMAVDPDAPKVERFLTLGGEERLLRYNSRLPIVGVRAGRRGGPLSRVASRIVSALCRQAHVARRADGRGVRGRIRSPFNRKLCCPHLCRTKRVTP
jgi:ecotin